MTGQSVYAAISNVQGALAKVGISKDRKNVIQGYQFRGIDDVYGALSPLLAEHGLNIIPRMLSRDVVERVTRNGGVMFYVTVHAEFDFVSAADGSKHTACTFGEASDSGDKATNKAMSAAYKYAAFMTFAIPTEGDNDADAHTPEAVAAPVEAVEWPKGPHTCKSNLKAAWKTLVRDLHSAGSAQEVEEFIDRDKDMLAQFRRAAKLGIDDLRIQFEGQGDFIGVAAELARARDQFVCVADAPREPGPPAAIADVEMAETTKVLLALIARAVSIKDVDAVIADNLELINAASDDDKQALREASTNAKAAIRAARNHPVNAG